MGAALCNRLLDDGADLAVYNRTVSKTAPLADRGATVVESPIDLADRDIVFTMVAGPADVLAVTTGDGGVLSGDGPKPKVLVDSSTIDPDTSTSLRERAAKLGTAVLAAPVSGNPKVVASGNLTAVVSGPKDAYEMARPYLETFGRKVTYVGAGDEARLVKIAHNLLLGIVAQTMAEITVLTEAAGVSRGDFLEFLNDSVMGSTFTKYKSPALVNLDFKPTFTWHLLRKDFELGLAAGRDMDVPLPTAALVHQIIIEGIGQGYGDEDFAALLVKTARGAGIELESEDREVDDGLSE
jgi:3-hydroxyisobutyrate dehydrogenase-like beta-hydroxyacid dehydrogenase